MVQTTGNVSPTALNLDVLISKILPKLYMSSKS